MRTDYIARADERTASLTEDEYRAATAAHEHLLKVLDIETRFDMLMESYVEVEVDLLRATVRDYVFGRRGRFHVDVTAIANRRLIGFFSVARAYVDQTSADFSSLFGKTSGEYESRKNALSAEYETSLEYRFMEELRNHSQHRGMPVHAVRAETTTDDSGRIHYMVDIGVHLPDLGAEFKAAVRDELADTLGDTVSLKHLVRCYVSSFGRAHEKARGALEPHRIRWQSTIASVVERFSAEGATVEQVVLEHQEKAVPVERHVLSLALPRMLAELTEKNHCLDVSNLYASGDSSRGA